MAASRICIAACVLMATACSQPGDEPASIPAPRSFDPAITDPFAYDAAAPLNAARAASRVVEGVDVEEVTFAGAGGRRVSALVVEPDEAPTGAIVYLHAFTGGAQAEALVSEAGEMARNGYVCLLVRGVFPWTDLPEGLPHDQLAVVDQVIDLRRGADFVATEWDVEVGRIGIAGQDMGAMYAALAAGTDRRFAATVLMTPTPHFADWLVGSFPVLEGSTEEEYREGMAPLDPVAWIDEIEPRALLLQFGGGDVFVPDASAAELTAAAGSSHERMTYPGGHGLNPDAREDRIEWLLQQLR
jgi:dienelactone hydrolase